MQIRRPNPPYRAVQVAEAQQALASSRQLRDFVRSFGDGKISLNRFLAGPGGDLGRDFNDDPSVEIDEFNAFMAALFQEEINKEGTRGPRGRNRDL